MTTFRKTDDEFNRLESRFDSLRNEYHICKRKLDSKCQALLILSKELDQCRSERDQFKLMAEQLRERYQGLKKHLIGKNSAAAGDSKVPRYLQNSDALLYEERVQNKSLQFEIEDLKQKLHDAQGDIKLLREQIARQRVGTTDEGMNTRHFPAHEREDLVRQLEESKEQYTQLEKDLQQVLDEREETITEKDAYKSKYERLNQELNYILKGDEKRVVDLDAIIMENKYLQERLKQMEEEKTMAMATVSKYKNLLERKKMKSSLKLGQNRSGGLVITQKQVHQVLESQEDVPPSPQAMADVKALASALLDTINDKSLALSHQRKTNKILGNRIAELEKKIKTLEVAGLWNVPSSSSSIEKLKSECDDVKSLIPQVSTSSDEERKQQNTDSKDGYHDNNLQEEEFCSPSPLSSSTNTSPLHSSSAHSVCYSPDLSSPSESSCNTPLLEKKLNDNTCLSTPRSSPKRNSDNLCVQNDVSVKSMCDSKHNQDPINCSKEGNEYSVNIQESRNNSMKEKGENSEKVTLLNDNNDDDIDDSASDDSPNRLVSETMEIIDTDEVEPMLSVPRKTSRNSGLPDRDSHCQTPTNDDQCLHPTDDELREMETFCSTEDGDEVSDEKLSELVENMTSKMLTNSQSRAKTKKYPLSHDKTDQSDVETVGQSECLEEEGKDIPNSSSSLLGDQEGTSRTVRLADGPRNVEC